MHLATHSGGINTRYKINNMGYLVSEYTVCRTKSLDEFFLGHDSVSRVVIFHDIQQGTFVGQLVEVVGDLSFPEFLSLYRAVHVAIVVAEHECGDVVLVCKENSTKWQDLNETFQFSVTTKHKSFYIAYKTNV